MRGMLKVERLTGDNKYACPHCPEKQDALKGTKFVALPPILMLQLNRFTLDMTTFNRKKINEKVAFPLVLNVNPFLDTEATEEQFK
jgi:ubiquitin C-terminal hydrolase